MKYYGNICFINLSNISSNPFLSISISGTTENVLANGCASGDYANLENTYDVLRAFVCLFFKSQLI